jgi:hypothetical protein
MTAHKDVIFTIYEYQYNLFSICGDEPCGIIDGKTEVVQTYYQYDV